VKLKPVPEPPARPPLSVGDDGAEPRPRAAEGETGVADRLADAQRAVPLVPGSETDCCERLRSRLGLADRRAARTWLTFLRALGLVRETEGGFVRTDRDPTPEAVRRTFRERIFGAEDLLALLEAEGPLTAAAAFERFGDRVPAWEREKHADWRAVWRERVERILGWAVLLGWAEPIEIGGEDGERTEEGYDA
jgi:hypothetical protein